MGTEVYVLWVCLLYFFFFSPTFYFPIYGGKILNSCYFYREMLVWLAVRLSWTLTEAGALMEAALSLGRITLKLTVQLPMRPAGWPSLWWRLICASVSWSRWIFSSLSPCNGEGKSTLLPIYPFPQVAYAIGVAHPLSISIFHYGTSQRSEKELLEIVKKNFDLRPGVIVR